ncbi:MAG: radical SAM protein [Sedimentisphaerales bacterium]
MTKEVEKKEKDRLYLYNTKRGITRSSEFEKKTLAKYAINIGMKCDNNCLYCSTGAMLRTHKIFKEIGRSPFDVGYAIIDKDKASLVSQDAKRMRNRGLVQLCTTTDAWSPSARKYNLGRKCLEAVLNEDDWQVRILTKNKEVEEDFDLIHQYRDRVLVGMSITATADKSSVMKVIEENAAPIQDRMRLLEKAHRLGLRTYGMFCPLLPGVADKPEQIDSYIQFAESIGVEEIFAEAVNPRGRGLILTQNALEENGYTTEAQAIEAIRNQKNWSEYTVRLIRNLQQSVRKYADIKKLKFLLYPKGLMEQHLELIKKDDAGVIWL